MDVFYIDKSELEQIKLNNLTYKEFLRYYKLSILLNDKKFYEILSNTFPKDLDEITEEKFGELEARLKMKLAMSH